MKKLIFNVLCLFLAGFAQSQIVIEGTVTNALTGAPIPVAGWKVEATYADSVPCCPGPPAYFGSGETDSNGHYHIELQAPATSMGTAVVQTLSYCDPNGGGTVSYLTEFAPIVNGAGTANFSVCADTTTFPSCYTYGWYDQNTPGLSVQLHGQAYDWADSTATFTFLWTFPDGTTSSDQNPTFTFPASGSYLVQLVATSANCTSTADVWVYVYEPYSGPVDTITVSGYVLHCADSTAISGWYMQSNGVDIFNQPWALTDSLGFYQMTFVVPAGQDTVSVFTYDYLGFAQSQTVSLTNGVGFANFLLCGDPPPPPAGCWAYFKYYPTDSLTYQFEGFVWSNDPNASNSAQYLWDFGDGTTGTGQFPTHTYAGDGVYSVTLETVDSTGCESFSSDVVSTFGYVDSFYYNCQAMFWAEPLPGSPLTLVFHDASFGTPDTWTWTFDDGTTSTDPEPVHTFADEGLHTVTLDITTADGCASQISMAVYVGNNPWNQWYCQAQFLPIPDSTGSTGFYFYDFSQSPSGIDTWAWDFGDNTTSSEQNPYHAYAQPGVYHVSLTIWSAADSCSSVFTFDLDTNDPMHFLAGGGGPGSNAGLPVLGLNGLVSKVTELPDFQGLRLFPNPSSDAVNLTFTAQADGQYTLRVSDLTGKILSQRLARAMSGTNVVRVEIADLPQGIYLAQLVSGKAVQAVKFSKI